MAGEVVTTSFPFGTCLITALFLLMRLSWVTDSFIGDLARGFVDILRRGLIRLLKSFELAVFLLTVDPAPMEVDSSGVA